MLSKHEVKLNIDVTAFVIQDSEDSATKYLANEVEAQIMELSHSTSIEVDSVYLQAYEATEI